MKITIYNIIFICFSLFFALASPYDYDLVIIGAGAAGIEAAINARSFKKNVALIESDNLDKIMILRNTTAIRSLVHVANTLYYLRQVHNYGIEYKDMYISYEKLLQYIEHVTQSVHHNILGKLDHAGIQIIQGSASFVDAHTLAIGDQLITTKSCIIATGSIPAIPKLAGIEHVQYLTPENFFEQKTLPESIIIVGAGQLGVEVAISLQRLGCKTILLMKHGLILPTFDYEMVQVLERILEKEGLTIRCGCKTTAIEQIDNTITITCNNWENTRETFSAQAVFIATNRKPNIEHLNLDRAGIVYSQKGIHVNEFMQTNIENIYACGDVVGSHISVRSAYYQARIATHNALSDNVHERETVPHKNFTQIIYSSPCYAAIGFNEQDAFALYAPHISIYHFNYSLLDKAHIEGNTGGTAKFIFNEHNQVIGAHILGPHADELIGWVEIGKTFHDSTISTLQTTYPYPSYLDIFWNISCQQTALLPKKNTLSWTDRTITHLLQFIQSIYKIFF